MAGLRISQLPAGTAVAAADVFPFSSISGSETRKVTAAILSIALGLQGNSTGPTQPSAPTNGQLWMDTSTNPPVLKTWNGATWTIISFLPGSSIITSPAATGPSSPQLGQLWQDTSQTPDELKMWDGSNWVRVDPQGITQTAGDARYLQIAAAASTYLALSGGTLTGNLTLPGVPTTTNMAATKGYVDTQIAGIPAASDMTPAGTVIYTARTTAPTGYLKANGAAVSRTTYATLFAAIGTTYGVGDGSTTFNLPDLRGEFVRGFDDGRGVDSGRAMGSSQVAAFASHTHGVSDPGHGHSVNDPGHSHSVSVYMDRIASPYGAGTTHVSGAGTSSVGTTGSGTGISVSGSVTGISVGNSGGTETRPRNIALLACIRH
jgi:phage-related tail fiber protein